MRVISQRDLVQPHIAELRQHSAQTRQAQAAKRGRQPSITKRSYKILRSTVTAPAYRALSALGLH
jgi:hypothetical protein